MRNQPSFLHEIYNFNGTPYEIGYQRGKQTSEFLRSVLSTIPDHNIKEKNTAQYNNWEKALDKTPEWLQEEARGVAEGAGVSYEKLIMSSPWFPLKFSALSDENNCCGFIAFGKGTVEGQVIVGGNGETDHASIKHMGIVRVKNKSWNNFVLQTKRPWEPCGQCGINDKGVALFGSGVRVLEEDYGIIGYGQMIRRRVLQEANDLDEAIDIFKEGPLVSGHHIYLGDEKRAVHIEHSGKHIEVIEPEKGFDAGASSAFKHPNMKKCLPYITDINDPRYWDIRSGIRSGIFRMERFHELFEKMKPLTLEMVPKILGDHGGRGTGLVREDMEGACLQGSDFTICVHGSRNTEGSGVISSKPGATLGSFHSSGFSNIEVPNQRKMYIAFGNPCESGYVPFYPPN